MAEQVERDNIGFFGKMNAGKSNTSIVDETAGTTTDTKITYMEIHGLGPAKMFDTAGANEYGRLGEKKKEKVIETLKKCDLSFIVINPAATNFDTEKELIDKSRELDKQILVIYNLFNPEHESRIKDVEKQIPLLKFYRRIRINAVDPEQRQPLLNFILENYISKSHKMEFLPFVKENEYYIMNIPMDEQTPPGRYLRPQAMADEYICRHWAYPVSYRMDLYKMRSRDESVRKAEQRRFFDLLDNFKKRPKAIITDSQAMDVLYPICPEDIDLTTFSITMINYMSKGKLSKFVEGTLLVPSLKPDDKILIVEACQHSRIAEDIGTKQIPNWFNKNHPGMNFEFNFGKEFQKNQELDKYKLIIHCGGCMIDSQTLQARLRDLDGVGIPYTNYGLFLSYMRGRDALKKVLVPWGLDKLVEESY
jgi:[FeFe] hydrogenase H-cluster maturation GTPase HydF